VLSYHRVVDATDAAMADLMIEHEVGVTSRAVRVPKIDSDYFEE
jgi:restriction system protein